MTLLSEIQGVLERTYAPTGLALEECLISRQRSEQLQSILPPAQRSLCGWAHTFLRIQNERLYVALYYHPRLISRLETEPPHQSISHRNIHALMAFTEEITHGVHACLAYRRGLWKNVDLQSPVLACDLETRAKVDTYFLILRFIRLLAGQLDENSKQWVKHCLFATDTVAEPYEKRYRIANWLAQKAIIKMEAVSDGNSAPLIRYFQPLPLIEKWRWVR
ncbi:MAG: hypothetical protein AAFY98_09680 [Verrucomicrobiota bacterium]